MCINGVWVSGVCVLAGVRKPKETAKAILKLSATTFVQAVQPGCAC